MMALYVPGMEPDEIKQKLETFFEKLNAFYPDKNVVGLHEEHKKLGERLTALYRELGYSSGQEMLEAYGYTYVLRVRKAQSTGDRENDKKELFAQIRELNKSGKAYTSVSQLVRDHPEVESKIKALRILKKEFLEEGILTTIQEKQVRSNEQLVEELHRMLQANDYDSRFLSFREISEYYPETTDILVQIRENCKTNDEVNAFLLRNGLLRSDPVSDPAAQKKEFTLSDMHRGMLLGDGLRQYASVSCAVYGMKPREYLEQRSVVAPGGKIGAALRLISEVIQEIDSAAQDLCVQGSQLNDITLQKLWTASEDAGYPSPEALLHAYGYTTIGFPAKPPEVPIIQEASAPVEKAKLLVQNTTLCYLYPGSNPPDTLKVPDGITCIGEYALAGCPCKRIILPDTVTVIKKKAFKSTRAVEIFLPPNIQNAEPDAFTDNRFLKRIIISDTILKTPEDVRSYEEDNKKIPYLIMPNGKWLYLIDYDVNNRWDREKFCIEAERTAKRYRTNCRIIHRIKDFQGKYFVSTGGPVSHRFMDEMLRSKGAYYRERITGKTDYLVVFPEYANETRYCELIQQSLLGHSIEVIFTPDLLRDIVHDPTQGGGVRYITPKTEE